jgi:hypothetical protein
MFKNSMIRKNYQFNSCLTYYNTYRKDIELLIALLYYEYIISFSVQFDNYINITKKLKISKTLIIHNKKIIKERRFLNFINLLINIPFFVLDNKKPTQNIPRSYYTINIVKYLHTTNRLTSFLLIKHFKADLLKVKSRAFNPKYLLPISSGHLYYDYKLKNNNLKQKLTNITKKYIKSIQINNKNFSTVKTTSCNALMTYTLTNKIRHLFIFIMDYLRNPTKNLVFKSNFKLNVFANNSTISIKQKKLWNSYNINVIPSINFFSLDILNNDTKAAIILYKRLKSNCKKKYNFSLLLSTYKRISNYKRKQPKKYNSLLFVLRMKKGKFPSSSTTCIKWTYLTKLNIYVLSCLNYIKIQKLKRHYKKAKIKDTFIQQFSKFGYLYNLQSSLKISLSLREFLPLNFLVEWTYYM